VTDAAGWVNPAYIEHQVEFDMNEMQRDIDLTSLEDRLPPLPVGEACVHQR
jgi:hypothetical protein